jgi:peroxiredoxin
VWINGLPTTVADQRDKVVVLLFWTHECINCQHNLGYWNDWARKYRRTDVVVLSVHTPETPSEYKIAHVRRFVRERKLLFPVVTDNDARTWTAYGIRVWPSEVLIDKQGRIRDQFEGELNWNGSGEYRTVEDRIEALRAEKPPAPPQSR